MDNKTYDVCKYWDRQIESLPSVDGYSIIKLGEKKYYVLDKNDNSIGMSDKLALISETQFDKLKNANKPISIADADAILKLPKHGDIRSVQNEAIALGISEHAFGLNTSKGTMVLYKDKPALFVPFDEMKPLKEFASGDKQTIIRNKTAHDNSTLDPLGEGLSPNKFVDDFGEAFGFMYYCGDKDTVGAYNQNKGLQGRKLFIFDNAVSGAGNFFGKIINLFRLDSRFRLTTRDYSGTRHYKGRNFSLLEDASISEKFDSLSEEKFNKVLDYNRQVISGMEADLNNGQIPQNLKAQHKQLIASAKNTMSVIENRRRDYLKMLPKTIGTVDSKIIKNSLILENILNNPRSYSVSGRPYRSLFAIKEHNLKVRKLEMTKDGYVKITFNKSLLGNSLLRSHNKLVLGGKFLVPDDGNLNAEIDGKSSKTLLIKPDKLENLENIFYPENADELDSNIDYLNHNDIENIARGYDSSPNSVDKYFIDYKKNIKNIYNINETRSSLNNLQNVDIGFKKHMIKRFEFEAQKDLQNMVLQEIGKKIPGYLTSENLKKQNDAFASAIKLDCIQEFNKSCMHFVQNSKTPEIENKMTKFFEKYSKLELADKTINEAQHLQATMRKDMQEILDHDFKDTNAFKKLFADTFGATTSEIKSLQTPISNNSTDSYRNSVQQIKSGNISQKSTQEDDNKKISRPGS